ncbi:MAG: hypothetical protein OQL06_07850 [Gammaproteobacteria bacterium]|nr:hypothetical protein [Gammaproteobacteria bacterium]
MNSILAKYRLHSLLVISMLLLMMQFVTAAHSIDHIFHEHSIECDLYLASEHNSSGLLSDFIVLSPAFQSGSEIDFYIYADISVDKIQPSSRDPPAHHFV